jgi:hypothetical protein
VCHYDYLPLLLLLCQNIFLVQNTPCQEEETFFSLFFNGDKLLAAEGEGGSHLLTSRTEKKNDEAIGVVTLKLISRSASPSSRRASHTYHFGTNAATTQFFLAHRFDASLCKCRAHC